MEVFQNDYDKKDNKMVVDWLLPVKSKSVWFVILFMK